MKKIFIVLIFLVSSIVIFAQTDEFKRHLVRAETALQMGHLPEAVSEYKEALKLDSLNGSLYYNLAVVQEKIGTIETLKSAIENYKKYLNLEPNCTDKDAVESKIYAIEYKQEDQIKHVQHLQNLNGTWRSDIYVKKTGLPLWFFDISLVNDELRITVLPKGALYKSDFTYQTVTIPFNEESVAFAFTNDKVTAANTNSTEHTIVDLLASQSSNASLLSPLLHGVLNATATEGYETLSSYIFKLKIIGDSIVGTMQVIDKKVDGKGSKIIGDEIEQISFNKSTENYPLPELTEAEKEEQKLNSYYLGDGMGFKLGYLSTGPTTQMSSFGLNSGISLGLVTSIINFSQKRSFVKLGLYLNDDLDIFIGKEDPLKANSKDAVLSSISINIGPAVTFYPARKTSFSLYYALRPSLMVDFNETYFKSDAKFVFTQGLGFILRYKKVFLSGQYNNGKTKYDIDDDTQGEFNLKYSVISLGLMFNAL